MSAKQKVESLRSKFEGYGQEHVFKFVDKCSEQELEELYEDLNVSERILCFWNLKSSINDHSIGWKTIVEVNFILLIDAKNGTKVLISNKLIISSKIGYFSLKNKNKTKRHNENCHSDFFIHRTKILALPKPKFNFTKANIRISNITKTCFLHFYHPSSFITTDDRSFSHDGSLQKRVFEKAFIQGFGQYPTIPISLHCHFFRTSPQKVEGYWKRCNLERASCRFIVGGRSRHKIGNRCEYT